MHVDDNLATFSYVLPSRAAADFHNLGLHRVYSAQDWTDTDIIIL